jgi:hypothetical protein
MTKEEKKQAIDLLEKLKNEIVKQQSKAVTRHDSEEYNQLYKEWMLLDNIQELLIYGEKNNG